MNKSQSRIRQTGLVLREMMRSPADMGTICPSSRALAGAMADAVSPSRLGPNDLVVELGAGTGPVTAALLSHGVPQSNLLVVEKSEPLAACLKEKFPDLDVRCDAAEDLAGMAAGRNIRAVISSLPFRTLPRDVSLVIMSEIEKSLSRGGLYAQFTYALLGGMPYIPRSFKRITTRIVLLNIPPAKVVVFRKS